MFAEWGKACQKDPDLRNHPQSQLFNGNLGKLFLENTNRHFYVLRSLIGSKAIIQKESAIILRITISIYCIFY